VRDEQEPRSEAEGSASWVASVRSPARAEVRPTRRWLRALQLLGFLGAAGLATLGFFRERSLDVDLGDASPHFGLHGQRLPTAWICPEGHQHYSLPYWMGGLLVALGVAALARLVNRRDPRARWEP
jgi:hypothetical protein